MVEILDRTGGYAKLSLEPRKWCSSAASRRMSILVVCPGCRKSFKVSDKFAGKSGGCPKCKAVIQIPLKKDEVKVHGPATSRGDLAVKPIPRLQTKLKPVAIAAIAAAAVGVLLLTWVAGGLIRGSVVVRVIGLLLVSPPLVVAAYSFLRDDEMEPYQSKALYIRAGICAVAYAVLWGIYGYVTGIVFVGGPELLQWFFVIPPFLVAGTLVPLACLDLDLGSGFFHYAFYLLVTMLLRTIAGMGWL